MKRKNKNNLTTAIIVLLLLITIVLGYLLATNSCCQEVNKLQVDQNKLKNLDKSVTHLLLDLEKAKDTIEVLQIRLKNAKESGDLDSAGKLLKIFDNFITKMKGIDDEMQTALKEIGPIAGAGSLQNACNIVATVVERSRQELEYSYNEIDRYNRELRDANQTIAELKLTNARLSNSLDKAISDQEQLRKDKEDLLIQVAELKGQLAVANNDLALANSKIQDLELQLTSATTLIGKVKNSIPITFEVNMRKFVAKEGKSFKIPVIIKENVALLQSHEKRNCIVYLRVGRRVQSGVRPEIHYLETNNTMTYEGKKKSYNGVYSFEWDGSEMSFDIDVFTTEKKKIKLTRDNFIYDYYIFMEGQENVFKEDCLPNVSSNKK